MACRMFILVQSWSVKAAWLGMTRLGWCIGCGPALWIVGGVWWEEHEDSPDWPWSKVCTFNNSLKITTFSWISVYFASNYRAWTYITLNSFPEQEVGLLHSLSLHVELNLANISLNLRTLSKAICENLYASYLMFFSEVYYVCFTICYSLIQDQLIWVSTQLFYIQLPF